MSQDSGRTLASRSPQKAIYLQVRSSLSSPVVNHKTMLHTIVSIKTQWAFLANKNSVSLKMCTVFPSLFFFYRVMFFENSSVSVSTRNKTALL